MKYKKIAALFLTCSLVFGNILPTFAVENLSKTDKKYTHKVKKSRYKDDKYKYEYINLDWWQTFNDDYLTEYIIKAVQYNHDLKMASIAVDEYYQYTKIQFASELPMVGAGFSPALVKSIGKTNWDWTFITPGIVNYEADIFLKNHDKTKSVKKTYEGAIQDERASYIAIASAVGTTYFNIVKLDELIKYQEKITDLRKNIYDLTWICNQEGTASMSDTVKANKLYVYGMSELPDLKKNRSKLLHQLAVLIGENPDDVENLPRKALSEIKFTGNLPKEISSEIIVNRPDYIKSELMLEKAGIDIRVAKKEFLPTINLTGVIGFTASDLGRMFNTKTALSALAAGMLLPVFTGGKRLANLRLKKSTYDRVLENYFKINQTAIQEINDALVVLKQDYSKLEQNQKHADLEEKDFELTKSRYEEGVISKRDYYQMEENLISIQKLVASNTSDCLINAIGLYKAAGSRI